MPAVSTGRARSNPMEALSRIFGGPDVIRRERTPQPAPASGRKSPSLANAASVSLPLRFLVTGLFALMLGIALLTARPAILSEYHYNQYVIAATHLLVLGWLCSV